MAATAITSRPAARASAAVWGPMATTGRRAPVARERPRSRAGHEQRDIGVGHVGAQLDRPVQRQEVRLQNVPPRTLRGREQERSTRQLVTQALLRVGRRDEVDVQPV